MNLEHSHIEAGEKAAEQSEQDAYQAPVVEAVLTSESLEREVLLGVAPVSTPTPT